MVLLISIVIRLAAMAWSVVILRRVRDWRIGFLTLMLGLMATRQILTLLDRGEVFTFTGQATISELPGLAVSVMAFLAVLGLERILTRERRAGDERRASEQLLRRVIDLVPHMIFARRRDGSFLLANRATAEAYGVEADSLEGRKLADVHAQSAETRRMLAADGGVIDRGGPSSTAEESFTDSRGRVRTLQTTRVPLSSDVAGGTAVLAVAVDVTEVKQLARERRHAQKLEAIGSLAGGIAHDFNNLLTAIIGCCDLLLHTRELDPRDTDTVGQIRRAADRAAELTRQLLAFGRKQVLQPRVIELNGVLTGVGDLLRRVIGENIELRYRLAPDAGWVNIDASQLEQVIVNLAVNARDAMPGGGVLTIATSRRPARDGVEGAAVDERVELSVADDGVGMDGETVDRIFEPFFTTKAPGVGTGLGLSTVHGIVSQSGGTIACASEPGRGTVFRILLPRVAAPAPVAALPVPRPGTVKPAAERGDETILVLEDEGAVREVVCHALRRRGYDVIEARNSREAIELCRRHAGPIHLLLTDVVLPDANGFELARQVSALRGELPVIYMSGYSHDAVGQRRELPPDVEFLQKPFGPAALAGKVRRVLDAERRGR